MPLAFIRKLVVNSHQRQEETSEVVQVVMQTVGKYEVIDQAAFEDVLDHVIQQVHARTGIPLDRVSETTPDVIDALPREYGQLSPDERSWEALISYMYLRHLQFLDEDADVHGIDPHDDGTSPE